MKDKIFYWLRRLGVPVLTVALGVILVFSPDTASVLIAKILGWVLVLVGAGCAAVGLLGHPVSRTSRFIWAAVLALAGLWMLGNPLVLAKMIGRVLGIALMIQGARDISLNIRYNGGKPEFNRATVLAIATAVIGAVLVVLPLTTSRLVFVIVGVVLIFLGVGEIYDRLKGRPGIGSGDDPDIIDVEKL